MNDVENTVEMVEVTCVTVLPPVVWVRVTGHVVRVEIITCVVIISEVVGGGAGVVAGKTDVGVVVTGVVMAVPVTGIERVSVEPGV